MSSNDSGISTMDLEVVQNTLAEHLARFACDPPVVAYLASSLHELLSEEGGTDDAFAQFADLLTDHGELPSNVDATSICRQIRLALQKKNALPSSSDTYASSLHHSEEKGSSDVSSSSSSLQVGTRCRAKFSEDGVWYDAEITEIVSVVGRVANSYRVVFTDYGNSEVVAKRDIEVVDSPALLDAPIKLSESSSPKVHLSDLLDLPVAVGSGGDDIHSHAVRKEKRRLFDDDFVIDIDLDELDDDAEYVDTGDLCEMCKRPTPLTRHHLIPQKVHPKYIKRYGMKKKDLMAGCANICRSCHSILHRLYDHHTLAEKYNTVEKIMANDRLTKCVEYIAKQKIRSRRVRQDETK